MVKEKKKNSRGINIGTSSILVTFVLLCLVTFAALTYLSAQSDYNLSVQAARRTNYYYDANRMAEIYLADIESLLAKNKSESPDEASYLEGVDKLFADNGKINVTTDGAGGKHLDYEIPVNNTQRLKVSLLINYPESEDENLFYIEEWATLADAEWIEQTKNNTIDNLMEME